MPDSQHHRYPTSHAEDPLLSPTRTSYPPYIHSDARVRRTSSGAAPINGTSQEDTRHPIPSPQSKHGPIPALPSSVAEEVYSYIVKLIIKFGTMTPRSGAMSISSLLTTEAPPSPTVPHTTPSSSRHSNIQITASSSRPQRRKSSVEIPPPMPNLSLLSKKRKREGELSEAESVLSL
jgi:hypothetical protein